MSNKLINFIALSSFVALSAIVSGPAPVAAVAIDGVHAHVARGHTAIAKRKRSSPAKRCKARVTPPVTAEAAAATPAAAPAADNKGGDNKGKPGPPAGTGASVNSANVGDYSQLGFAWTLDAGLLPSYKQDKKTLIYNWAETGPEVDGFEFMPMCWGAKNQDAFIAATNSKTPKFALGPNEPELNNDSGLSSGMSTDSVVETYWAALAPLQAKGTSILTPAVTSGQKGFDWMTDFMSKCATCNFAGQALHWYDTTAESAIAHFTKHHDQFKLDIYCTEIAFNNFNGGDQLSKDQAFTEMGKFNDWVKTQNWMKVVMYFGFQSDMVNVSPILQLIDPGSNMPNDLGSAVISSLKQ